jgi:hypothetical protein
LKHRSSEGMSVSVLQHSAFSPITTETQETIIAEVDRYISVDKCFQHIFLSRMG